MFMNRNGQLLPSFGPHCRQFPFRSWISGFLLAAFLAPAVAFGQNEQSDLESSFFLPIPREARLRLERIQKAADEEKWTDAAQDIMLLLAGENAEDFLSPLDSGKQTTSQSVKSTTLELVQNLPPNVLKAYDLLVGTEPDVLLQEAISENNERKLADVSRRFLFTPAGEKAAIILARKAMDARQWEGALLALNRLDYKPNRTRTFVDESDLMRAICLREVGQTEQAKAIISRLKDDQSLAKLLPGFKIVGSTSPEQILDRLTQAKSGQELPPYAWTMFQGSVSRTAPSRGSEPLQEIQWNARMAQSQQQQDEIRASMRQFLDNRIPIFPAIHPVVVQNQVVFRTPSGLLATDIQSGKVLWKYPWDNLDLDLSEKEPDLLNNIFPGLGRDFERAIWADARSGHLSSDGTRLFYVHDDQPAGDNLGSILANSGLRNAGGMFTGQQNHLYCFDIAREGAILWQLGGVGSEGNQEGQQLSEARFLGPPLPLGDDLLVLAGIIDEIRLLSLDAETGQIQWSQQLARQTTGSSADLIESFLQAATPSHKGGILVCPTNSGSVVAVDLSNQTLLWGFQYKEPDRNRPGRRISGREQGTDFLALADRWNDGTPMIHQGKVLITPTDADYLYCLDLLTGEKLWELPRRDNVALATVAGEVALVIGKTEVMGVNIESGEPAWKNKEIVLPELSLPSGYGFRLDDKYYLPTTKNQIVPIELADGKLGTPIEAVGELGNLVCYKDYVISVSPEFVTAYKQIDALRREVAQRLAQNPNDAEALRMQGKLQKHDGNLGDALVSLQRSIDIESNDETRTQLVITGLAALGQDFSRFRDVVDELEGLVDSLDERITLARLTARGLHAEGKHDEALKRYFEFLDLTDEYLNTQVVPNELLIHDFDPQVEVSADRWARGKISQLRDLMTEEERERADQAVQARLDKLLSSDGSHQKQLTRFINRFPRFPATQSARIQLAGMLLDKGLLLQGEGVLRTLLAQDLSPEQSGPLVFKLGTGLKKAGLANEAAAWFTLLSSEYSNIPVDGNRTGRQVAALQQWDPVAAAIVRERTIWPYSATKVDITKRRNQGFSRVDHPIRLDEVGMEARSNYSLLLDSEANLIIVQDEFGEPIVRIPFTTQSGRKLYHPQISALHARQFGHLLVLSLGSELQAFNMMPSLPSEDSSRMIWNADLQNGIAGSTRRTREFDVHSKANPFSLMDRIARDVTTRKTIGQFAGNQQLICYQIGSRLICRDPATGSVYWERDGAELGCELVVTDKHVIAIPQDDNHDRGEVGDTVEALVLSADNGELLQTVELPSADRIWTVRDGTVVAWQKAKEEAAQGLDAYDAVTGKKLWTKTYEAGMSAKGVLLDRQPWIAMLDKLGNLEMINIPDGKTVHQRKLARKEPAVQLKIVESDDQFLLAVYREITSRPQFRSIPYDQSETLLRGEIYAFDTNTGEMTWETPALVHDNYLLETFQSSGLPAIALVARLHRPDARTPQMNSALEVLLLDKRDGRTLFRQEFGELSGTFSLTGDPSEKSLRLQLTELEIKLTFDPDEPAVPAPPAATEIDFSYPPSLEEESP